MKKIKQFTTLLLCLVLILVMAPFASAESVADTADEYIGSNVSLDDALQWARDRLQENEGKTLSQIAAEHNAILWHYNPYGEEEAPEPKLSVSADQSWDDVIQMLLEKYNVPQDMENANGNVTIGYYNTVTGEEHYYHPDDYLVSASMFKIPLNMIYTDRVANGEMTFTTNVSAAETYDYFQYRTIVHSDNERAYMLIQSLGGYTGFKNAQIDYLGSNPVDDIGSEYYNNNWYKPSQILNCLKMIYAEPDRFNGILQNMLEATPYEYLQMFQHDYPVAQKYGFIDSDGIDGTHTFVNVCGVIYTDEPILVVIFTDNINKAYDVIGEFSTLMCEYTELAAQKQAESEEKAEAAMEDGMQRLSERKLSDDFMKPTPVAKETSGNEPTVLEAGKELKMTVRSFIVIVGIAILMLLCFVLLFRRNKASRIRNLWAVLAVLIVGCGLIFCVVAMSFGTVYAEPEGNPQDTANQFFSSICSGNYEQAYSVLSDYSTLGLENEPESEIGQTLYQALKSSYSYSLVDDPKIDQLTATQTVYFRYLDLNQLEDEVTKNMQQLLNQTVEGKTDEELYDENGDYRSEILDEAYQGAIEMALQNVNNYCTSAQFDVTLKYNGTQWLMETNDEMLHALLGGV